VEVTEEVSEAEAALEAAPVVASEADLEAEEVDIEYHRISI
jgi:hypothetical protein